MQANYVDVLWHTTKDAYYTNHKDALNADTTEIRQYKRSCEQKLASNVKMTAIVFMHMSEVSKSYETRLDA